MKLTAEQLKKIISEEVAKLQSPELDNEKAVETDADELADAHEQQVDFLKALKIKEQKLEKALKLVKEQKRSTVKKILGRI